MADGGQVVYYASPRPAVTWPHQVGVLPRQVGCFQDRAAVEQLEQALAHGGTAVLCQVLVGMGGVGKTQLAAHHARQVWAEDGVDLLMWVSATTREAVISAYAQAAAEVLGADLADLERAARAFLAWLEPKPGTGQRRWLVVLDDAADPADLRGLWPPTSPHGRTLITTRRRDAALAGNGFRLVPVGLFTPAEAVAYLTTTLAAHGRLEPSAELAALATDLGHLPLALSQAVAYLIDADLDCATYRTLLADRSCALTELLPGSSSLPDDQATTAAAAWSLSVDRADQLPPVGLAGPMLQFAAMLDPNGIPASVLTSQPALAYLTEHWRGTADQTHTRQVLAPEVSLALRALHRLSLIDHSPKNFYQAVRIHLLVQRATRDALTAPQRERLALAAADALIAAWPDIEREAILAQALRANTTALARHAEDVLYQGDGAHPALFRAGSSLGQTGQLIAAIDHFQSLANTTHERLGPDHPDTLTARNNLAYWQGEAGDPVGAAAAFADLLADRERVLGPDHLHTLATRHNLAALRGRTGDRAGAVAASADLLADRERVLGPDHPDTLATRSNLAYWQGEAGDPVGAAAAFADLLENQLRVLGPDHPHTLRTRRLLDFWRNRVDRYVHQSTD